MKTYIQLISALWQLATGPLARAKGGGRGRPAAAADSGATAANVQRHVAPAAVQR